MPAAQNLGAVLGRGADLKHLAPEAPLAWPSSGVQQGKLVHTSPLLNGARMAVGGGGIFRAEPQVSSGPPRARGELPNTCPTMAKLRAPPIKAHNTRPQGPGPGQLIHLQTRR